MKTIKMKIYVRIIYRTIKAPIDVLMVNSMENLIVEPRLTNHLLSMLNAFHGDAASCCS